MKKYSTPLFNIVEAQMKDIITVSVEKQGEAQVYTFGNIISDGSGWIKS